ncbi:hypothetical protein Efla_000411 [Eimeria flavescens]
MALSLAESLFGEPGLPPSRLFSSRPPASMQSWHHLQGDGQQQQQHGLQLQTARLLLQTTPPPLALRPEKPSRRRVSADAAAGSASLQGFELRRAGRMGGELIQQPQQQQKGKRGVYCLQEPSLPAYIRLCLIGKTAATATRQALLKGGGGLWCAECIRKDLAASRTERQKESVSSGAAAGEARADPPPAAHAARRAADTPQPAAAATAAAKRIHVGPRMFDGSRVWPPSNWAPKGASSGDLAEQGAAAGRADIREEGVALLVSPYGSRRSGSSGNLVELETQCSHPKSLMCRQLRGLFGGSKGASATAEEPIREEKNYYPSWGRTTAQPCSSSLTDDTRCTFASTAVPTSVASSPGLCSSVGSESSLSSAPTSAGIEQQRQQQQQHRRRPVFVDILPLKGHQQPVYRQVGEQAEGSKGLFASSGQAGPDPDENQSNVIIAKLAAIGQRLRRASVNALRTSLLGPPTRRGPCRRDREEC